MSEQNTPTLSDNEWIDKFMGPPAFVPTDATGAPFNFPHDYMYWNTLMPVIERLSSTGHFVQMQIDTMFNEPATCVIFKRKTPTISIKGTDLLKVTYEAVVCCIKSKPELY